MITRRTMLAASLAAKFVPVRRALAAETLPGVPPSGRASFEVFRNGSRIGTHTLDFASSGQAVTVGIKIRLAAGLGPITLFRYTMDGTERWAGGQFVDLETETNDDGTRHRVSARRVGNALHVRSKGLPDHQLPGEALPLTHWAIAQMSAPLFNPQDGKPIHDRAVAAGQEAVRLLSGQSVEATTYRLTGEVTMRDWYDEAQLWVKLRAKAKDGSNIDYRMV